MRTIYTLLLLIFTAVLPGRASQFMGGAIQVTQLTGQTYQIQVQLLSESNTASPISEQLMVCFGDGNTAQFSQSNSQPSPDVEGMQLLTYAGQHTYAEAGIYQIAVSSNPRSVSLINHTESLYKNLFLWTVINTNFNNNTPDIGALSSQAGLRQAFKAPLQRQDLESDSLTYQLVRTAIPSPGTCGVRMQAKQFVYPNDVEKEGVFYIDGANQLNWTAPTRNGNFYYAMLATEWRNGIKISESYRESMVNVVEKSGEKIAIPAYQSAETPLARPTPDSEGSSSLPELVVEAYPNPSEDIVNVTVISKEQQPIKIEVVNINGQVLETIQTAPVLETKATFSLKSYGAGLYLIKAQSSKGAIVKKMIVK